MAYTRRNTNDDATWARAWTADALVDLVSISAILGADRPHHGDIAYVTATAKYYLWMDDGSWTELGATGNSVTQNTIIIEGDSPDDPLVIPGPAGIQGATGAQGPQGLQGIPGVTIFPEDGAPGEDGFPIAGPAGAIGATGAAGAVGIGIPGSDGIDGEDNIIVISSIQGGEITITTTGNIDDLDFGNAAVIRMNNASLATIRGLKAGYDGQQVTIYAINAEVDLSNQNAGSSTNNRLINTVTSGVTPLAGGSGSATYKYDATTARWRLNQHNQGKAIDISGSTTIVGWSAFTSGRRFVWILLHGNALTVTIMLEGTSNSTFVNVTIPYTTLSACPAGTFSGYLGFGYDNGVALTNPGDALINGNLSVIGITATPNGNVGIGSWTPSGTKITHATITVLVD